MGLFSHDGSQRECTWELQESGLDTFPAPHSLSFPLWILEPEDQCFCPRKGARAQKAALYQVPPGGSHAGGPWTGLKKLPSGTLQRGFVLHSCVFLQKPRVPTGQVGDESFQERGR